MDYSRSSPRGQLCQCPPQIYNLGPLTQVRPFPSLYLTTKFHRSPQQRAMGKSSTLPREKARFCPVYIFCIMYIVGKFGDSNEFSVADFPPIVLIFIIFIMRMSPVVHTSASSTIRALRSWSCGVKFPVTKVSELYQFSCLQYNNSRII